MNEIIKLKEIAHQMEQGLDGLDLFLDTWDNAQLQLRPGGEVLSYSMAKEAAQTMEQVEDMYSLSLCGRAYLAGWNAVLGILVESLKTRRQKEVAEAKEQAAQESE